ncbi:MAG: tRNA (adenosine(37)-N6)-dimethylallyltransferase MiaA [Acidimicrobiales bacterium]
MRAPAVALVGPSASGKSALAHTIALEEGGIEILAADAMTVYRHMDLGTAKPSARERAEVTYHLLDLVQPSEEFSVRRFQRAARDAELAARRAGAVPLYVGGTGLYHRAVVDDLEMPGRYPELRRELEERVLAERETLYAELVRLDPLAASRLEAHNDRRLVRALEVTLGSGRPFSSFGLGLAHYGESRVAQVGLRCDLVTLDRRVEERFRRWMDEGLLDEVAALAARPGGLGRTARQAVGYRELLRHVEQGAPLEQCVRDALTQSRRLVRRQIAWFRRDPRVEWYDDLRDARRRLIALATEARTFVRDC